MRGHAPVFPPLPSALGPAEAFARLRSSGVRLPFFLDSGSFPGRSWIGADPEAVLGLSDRGLFLREGGREDRLDGDPFSVLGGLVAAGGFWAGFLSYDLGRRIEGTPAHRIGEAALPLMRFARYRDVLVLDHAAGTWAVEAPSGEVPRWRAALDGPSGPAPYSLGAWEPSVPKEEYLAAVDRVRAAIGQGEIYQANLSHRFTAPFGGDPWGFYAAFRRVHPAPFSAYLEDRDGAVACFSPECFLARDGERLSTVPIKGTRPRFADPARDAASLAELEGSPKDRAELAMIVDLERNDLGRVARTGSVRVEVPRRIVSYATVHHAEAAVACRLRPGTGWGEILRATFPGGSITGCPKIRAMQVLSDLEPFARGIYTGSIGWLTRDAGCLNIAIRTVVFAGGRAVLNVGGGIVADSDPESEHAETLHKGRAFLEPEIPGPGTLHAARPGL